MQQGLLQLQYRYSVKFYTLDCATVRHLSYGELHTVGIYHTGIISGTDEVDCLQDMD
jgi:hypothetical protein